MPDPIFWRECGVNLNRKGGDGTFSVFPKDEFDLGEHSVLLLGLPCANAVVVRVEERPVQLRIQEVSGDTVTMEFKAYYGAKEPAPDLTPSSPAPAKATRRKAKSA